MKLCRFELLDQPGKVRSGIIYGGKVYETDGQNAIAVHEVDRTKPIAPIGLPPSIRIYDSKNDELMRFQDATPFHTYANPNCLIAPSTYLELPDFSASIEISPYLGIVVAESARGLTPQEAESYILGYTIANMFIARDVEGEERTAGSGPGRSRDVAIAIGPALTTPDELEEAVIDESDGKRFKLEAKARINGVEVMKGDAAALPYTPAKLVSVASESAMIARGDLILAGPIAITETRSRLLEPGDEIQVVVERLGMLATKIST
ncbi:MAG: fumarylacetoacetate hydrolase family protein [Armatimonadetes bacterium]|nr:fumarylacetoacetate hydrolase family protein [Armatimonadota bacterium]